MSLLCPGEPPSTTFECAILVFFHVVRFFFVFFSGRRLIGDDAEAASFDMLFVALLLGCAKSELQGCHLAFADLAMRHMKVPLCAATCSARSACLYDNSGA